MMPPDLCELIEIKVQNLYEEEHRERLQNVLKCIESYGVSEHEMLPDLIWLSALAPPQVNDDLFCRVSEAKLNHLVRGRIGRTCGCGPCFKK